MPESVGLPEVHGETQLTQDETPFDVVGMLAGLWDRRWLLGITVVLGAVSGLLLGHFRYGTRRVVRIPSSFSTLAANHAVSDQVIAAGNSVLMAPLTAEKLKESAYSSALVGESLERAGLRKGEFVEFQTGARGKKNVIVQMERSPVGVNGFVFVISLPDGFKVPGEGAAFLRMLFPVVRDQIQLVIGKSSPGKIALERLILDLQDLSTDVWKFEADKRIQLHKIELELTDKLKRRGVAIENIGQLVSTEARHPDAKEIAPLLMAMASEKGAVSIVELDSFKERYAAIVGPLVARERFFEQQIKSFVEKTEVTDFVFLASAVSQIFEAASRELEISALNAKVLTSFGSSKIDSKYAVFGGLGGIAGICIGLVAIAAGDLLKMVRMRVSRFPVP